MGGFCPICGGCCWHRIPRQIDVQPNVSESVHSYLCTSCFGLGVALEVWKLFQRTLFLWQWYGVADPENSRRKRKKKSLGALNKILKWSFCGSRVFPPTSVGFESDSWPRHLTHLMFTHHWLKCIFPLIFTFPGDNCSEGDLFMHYYRSEMLCFFRHITAKELWIFH